MKPIYLEPDEEITSIIDRISQAKDGQLAIVVPKNSTIFQSLVNLKLLARQAKKLGKSVAIISTNKVGSRLAKQVGLETYANVGTISPTMASSSTVGAKAEEAAPPDTLPDGTPVHRYSPDGVAIPNTTGVEVSDELPGEEEEPADVTMAESPPESSEPVKTETPSLPGGQLQPPITPKPTNASEERPKVSPTPPDKGEALPSIVSRGVTTTREFSFVFPWKSALVALGMVLVAAIVTFLFLPKATVTMTFPAKLLSAEFDLTARTTPVSGDGSIAGNLLTASKTATATVTATGKKDVGTKATGTVSIKNCEDSSAHELAAGSKLTSSSKTFLTNSKVTIPAGQFSNGGKNCNSTPVTVGITAEQAGDSYNLNNATFTITSLSGNFTVSGTTTGGTTKQVTILSQDDIDKAYASLTTQTVQEATADLKAKANGQTIIDAAIKQTIQEQKVDKAVGSQTDTATASMTVELYTIAFDQSAIEEASKTQLTKQLEANQQLVIPDDKKAAATFKDIAGDRSTMDLHVIASGFAAPLIDKTAVSKSVKNKSVGAAEAALKAKYQAEEVKIEVIPGWWMKRLPILSQAISVDYGFHAVPGS